MCWLLLCDFCLCSFMHRFDISWSFSAILMCFGATNGNPHASIDNSWDLWRILLCPPPWPLNSSKVRYIFNAFTSDWLSDWLMHVSQPHYRHTHITSHHITSLVCLGTFILPWCLRALGARIGKRTFINTFTIDDWDLVSIGDDVYHFMHFPYSFTFIWCVAWFFSLTLNEIYRREYCCTVPHSRGYGV